MPQMGRTASCLGKAPAAGSRIRTVDERSLQPGHRVSSSHRNGRPTRRNDHDPFEDLYDDPPKFLPPGITSHCRSRSKRSKNDHHNTADLLLVGHDGNGGVELTGLEPVTPTLPARTNGTRDLRKYRTRRSRGPPSVQSRRLSAVQTHRLLQICSTRTSVS